MKPTVFFFFNDTAPTEIYTLSLHDALPIWSRWETPRAACPAGGARGRGPRGWLAHCRGAAPPRRHTAPRSEEHTSELQSQSNLVCRLLLEKKNTAEVVTCNRVVVDNPELND